MAHFNTLVERFDMLTLWQCDNATPKQICDWFYDNDSAVIAADFWATARALGYFSDTQKHQ